MGMLQDKDKETVRKIFQKELINPVKIVNFTQELECQYCKETRQLLEEIAELSDKVILESYNFAIDTQKAEEFKVEKIPCTIIMSEDKDYGIRFSGIPSGYEFTTIIEAINMVSKGDSGLKEKSKQKLKAVNKPLHIQVYITPTCPYCPRAAILSYQMAFESDYITADVIEAIEFPYLANKYNVYGVPKMVVNEGVQFEGALPEPAFIKEVLKALK
ncbi:MAG: thioredoxin family protein [Synergistetes bacterium]|nr:thioredoxin family protein [Synergistota bacterium]